MSTGPLRVLVADDEPLVREGLLEPLAAVSGVEVVASCGSGREALQAIRRLRPHVAFLDVRMPGLDGFQVIEELSAAERPVVVFVTAFSEHALDAFRTGAVHYLLKPFTSEQVHEALARARETLIGRALAELAPRLEGQGEPEPSGGSLPRRLPLRVGLRTVLVDVERIDYVAADGNYVQIHAGGSMFQARETLSAIETTLGSPDFVRVHRSFLVRFERIRELRPAGGERWEVLLEGGKRLPVSEAGRNRLVGLLSERTPR